MKLFPVWCTVNTPEVFLITCFWWTRSPYLLLFSSVTVPWCCVHARSVHPFNLFSVSAVLSTRRGPCRSEAPSTARAAPGDHEPLIGGARWWSMGELRLGRSVTWSFCGWTYRQSTLRHPSKAAYNEVSTIPDASPSKDWHSCRLERLPELNSGVQVYSLEVNSCSRQKKPGVQRVMSIR
jgi:hypothetical protein